MQSLVPGRRWYSSVVAVVVPLAFLGACATSSDSVVSPRPGSQPRFATAVASPTGLVISQVYGGGGNAGATYTNDFIELYNAGPNPVNVTGWSVQYASTAGTSWTATALTGTIPSGGYYLVQEAAGANGTTPLPTPDASGSITMSANNGKVALVTSTTALTGTGCPFGATVADFVGFGTANCFEGTGATGGLVNTTAAIRKAGGQTDTGDNAADFSIAAPTPRNSSSPKLPPSNALVVTIAPSAPTTQPGGTVTFTASASQSGQPVAITSSSWSSSNGAVATIDAQSGVATAVAAGSTTIGVSVTTANGPGSATTTLTVAAAPAKVTVTPSTWSLKVNQTKAFTASATDATGTTVSTTFTWTSVDPTIATIDPSTGVATGKAVGSTTINATSANGKVGSATVTVTPPTGNISVAGRSTPLPVGFQTQLFLNGNGTDTQGNVVTNADLDWSTSDASVVAVDANTGVITSKSVGSAILTATAKSDGVTSGSTTITTNDPPVGASARVGHNTDLGTPTDANPSDDVLIARRQYTLSYNVSRGGPNWVSWNLDATHQGSSARCNCFTADTALTRLGFPAYDTNDWINGSVWSRGHMSPSADWADTDGDNAPTFFLSNMLPQNQTLNGGAWGNLESFLRTQTGGGAEIYVVSGGIFTKNRSGAGVDGFGFMNSLGHIAVPDSVWKIAIIVPDSRNVSQIGAPTDVQVIAANFPNDATGTGTWNRYATTIDKLQKSTGYDFLSAIPETIQCKLEVRNCIPETQLAGATTTTSGQTYTVQVKFRDGDSADSPWKIAIDWGDGSAKTLVTSYVQTWTAPLSRGHVYTGSGARTITVTVTDKNGNVSTMTLPVTVQ
jgi:DNA/RNA endonuclease G (NUC1)